MRDGWLLAHSHALTEVIHGPPEPEVHAISCGCEPPEPRPAWLWVMPLAGWAGIVAIILALVVTLG